MNDTAPDYMNFLGSLSAKEQKAVRANGKEVLLKAGEILFSQGDAADAFYVVLSGTMGIFVDQEDTQKRLIALIKKHETLGELSILAGEARSASVVALRDSQLLKIERSAFDELIKKHSAIAVPMSRILAQRLREATANRSLRLRPKVLTFIAASPSIDIVTIADRLAKTVTADCGESVHVQEANDRDWSSEKLSRLENEFDLIFLCCKLGDEDWMRSCARQSERICLVTEFSETTASEISRGFLDVQHDHQMVDLFILHDDANVCPIATQDYLEKIDANRHFHIRKSLGSEWNRWGRVINGRGIGLVLSGGGARAYAHIGVIKALKEAHVPIDFIAGSSMGGIIGACLAMGQSLEEMEASIRKCFVETNPLSDYTLPLQGLVKGKKVERLLRENFGKLEISDLWLPFFCVSTNLTTASPNLHTKGKIWRALRASISLPGVLPPVVADEGVLVDGGVINNLPTIEMAQQCFGPILAVDVSRNLGITPESWTKLIKQPLLTRIFKPPLISLLIRTGTVSGEEQYREQTESSYATFNPPLGGIDLRDWKAYDEAVEAGYQYMKRELETNDDLKVMCKVCGVHG